MKEPNITKEQIEIFDDFFNKLSPEEQSKYLLLYEYVPTGHCERFELFLIQFLKETDTTEIRRKLTGKMLPSY